MHSTATFISITKKIYKLKIQNTYGKKQIKNLRQTSKEIHGI